jgi:thymidylate kinase
MIRLAQMPPAVALLQRRNRSVINCASGISGAQVRGQSEESASGAARADGLLARKFLFAAIAAATLMSLLLAFHLRPHGYGELCAALALTALAAAISQLWPALETSAGEQPMAQLIALVGCDGSGKSTLSSDLLIELARDRPARICYLGLGSGEMGNRIKRWPLIGRVLERTLAGKAGQSRTAGDTIPGLLTALVVYSFSLARLRRFRRMLALRRAGVTVITDRYPQTEVPGIDDGPGLSAAEAGSWAVALLARQERRMYQWMASIRPDIVIRLNVDAETAHARKPDHRYDLLQQKVAVTPTLRFDGAPIVDLDSRQPYETVRTAMLNVVGNTLVPGSAARPH